MMSAPVTRVGVTPCHPGELIREEILAELGLPSQVSEPRMPNRSHARRRCPPCFAPQDTLLAWHDSHMIRRRGGEFDVKRYEPA